MAQLILSVEKRIWPMKEPFAIARGTRTGTSSIIATLTDHHSNVGRGEGCVLYYAGETSDGVCEQIEIIRDQLVRGATRQDLLELLPAGSARAALDAALWDLEAKQQNRSIFDLAGVGTPHAVCTAVTIGMRSVEDYHRAASQYSNYPLIKVKLGPGNPVPAIEACALGAPNSRLIVDPNQAWDVETLALAAPALAGLGVELIEQPLAVGSEALLDSYRCPIKLCADELINDVEDLYRAVGRFDVINIKLDKCGGLTSALTLAGEAKRAGFEVMVGCMAGSSLSMAPALVVAQQAAYVDLDGPLLQAEDWPDGLTYTAGWIGLPSRDFWG